MSQHTASNPSGVVPTSPTRGTPGDGGPLPSTHLPAGGSLDELVAGLVPVGIVRMDAAGDCTYVNERWCQLTGLPREAAYGQGWVRSVHPDDQDRIVEGWRHALEQRQEYAAEFRIRSAHGGERVVAGRALPLFERDGQLVGYLGAVEDITDRQRAEEELRTLAHKLGERVKELNCLFGISHIVERAGGSEERILQETLALLPPSWEYPEITCARIKLDGKEYRTENWARTSWKQTAVIYLHGQPSGVVEVAYLEEKPQRDEGPFLAEERALISSIAQRLGHIVERLRGEQLLEQREDELRKRLTHLTRVSTVGEMASSIAHEVNQPLTAIATYTQACQRMIRSGTIEPSEVHEVLRRITVEALRAGEIIHRLRHLVRKRDTERSLCDVGSLIREIEHLASVDARLHDVRLQLELEDPLPTVMADGIQIQQVILNLIRNAIDAMDETDASGRQVTVRTFLPSPSEIQVSVADNGCGLPENAEENLFQPFFTTKKTGMGMGLSISRSIVLFHGGRMWFERNPGGGATFYFTVPVSDAEGYAPERHDA